MLCWLYVRKAVFVHTDHRSRSASYAKMWLLVCIVHLISSHTWSRHQHCMHLWMGYQDLCMTAQHHSWVKFHQLFLPRLSRETAFSSYRALSAEKMCTLKLMLKQMNCYQVRASYRTLRTSHADIPYENPKERWSDEWNVNVLACSSAVCALRYRWVDVWRCYQGVKKLDIQLQEATFNMMWQAALKVS